MVRQCLHKPSTECYRSHSSGWWVIGGKPSSLKSGTLNQQVMADIPPRLTTTIAASSSNICCFKVELVLCTLKFLWSLAPVYFAYGTYS